MGTDTMELKIDYSGEPTPVLFKAGDLVFYRGGLWVVVPDPHSTNLCILRIRYENEEPNHCRCVYVTRTDVTRVQKCTVR